MFKCLQSEIIVSGKNILLDNYTNKESILLAKKMSVRFYSALNFDAKLVNLDSNKER